MKLAITVFYTLTTLFAVHAITVRVDRADVRQPEPQSPILNGWRPVTNYDKARLQERNPAPLHPVLGKFQEHMATSERMHSSQLEYNPLGVLGSFSRAIGQPSSNAKSSSDDGKNSQPERQQFPAFLIPPLRDNLRYEIGPAIKKSASYDSEPYVRASQYATQVVKPAEYQSGPAYYIKPASYSTGIHPLAQSRPFSTQYNLQPMSPARPAPKPFEAQEAGSEKPFIVSQHQLLNIGNSHYYNQINHPANYKTANYERNPAFLVHESHEVTYPSQAFKYRPSAYFTAPQTPQPERPTTPRPEPEKIKVMDKRPDSNFIYIAELQKTRFAPPDINEVLPKLNAPVKFGPDSPAGQMLHGNKVVYVRPELQHPQYQSSIIPLTINQRHPEISYETPEAISLKHFNEQQFMLQQQLIQQDRQRLREQEKRRQQELQRQQQEELNKRQEEIKQLEQRQKEKQQRHQEFKAQRAQELAQTTTQRPVKTLPEIEKKPPHQFYYQHFETPASPEPTFVPSVSTEESIFKDIEIQKFEISTTPLKSSLEEQKFGVQTTPLQSFDIQKFEDATTPLTSQSYVTQEEFQPMIRPYRPPKPLPERIRDPERVREHERHRDLPEPTRRRKPSTTIKYEEPPTEIPVTYSIENTEPLTEIPIQTTSTPESTTVPVTTERIRSRRPGIGLRRRRPTTTSTQEPNNAAQEDEVELTKYSTPLMNDFEKKKRVKSQQISNFSPETVSTRRPGSRSNTAFRNKEHHTEISIVERPRSTDRPREEISPTENYPEAFLKSEFNPADYTSTSERASYPTAEITYEYITNPVSNEYSTETSVSVSSSSPVEYFEATHENYGPTSEEPGILEQLFPRTEITSTETSLAPTSTEILTSAEPSSTTVKAKSPKGHRIRPMRFGNSTRPRFSIKDYKSRMDYKNRLNQGSSTEAPANTKQITKADLTQQSKGYKHVSRPYRTTSTTASSLQQSGETSSERPRYTPKKRPHGGFGGYSRRPSTPPTKDIDKENSNSKISAKSDNLYNLARKARPTMRNRLTERKQPDPSSLGEIATAESGPVAQSPSTEVSASPESPNEVESISIDGSEASREPTPETTTPFDIRSEEELFARASQSVADLTSSASALYEKPGLFKAVSPNGENRAISPHLRLATDEPTLPIEAFFQELTKKN